MRGTLVFVLAASMAACGSHGTDGDAAGDTFVDGEDGADAGDPSDALDMADVADDAPCTEGHARCTGNVLERCTGGSWVTEQDCDETVQTCTEDGDGASCSGLYWIHLEVEIDDPIMTGTSLMMPIDGPSFAQDPSSDLFVTQFGRDVSDPDITYLFMLDGMSGRHYKRLLSGDVFVQTEGFCVGAEDWCQFIGFDPLGQQWVVVGPSASVIMRVDGTGAGTLVPVSGSQQPDAYIGRTHRFDWTERKLLLHGATGPSSFSHTVHELDLDTGVWREAVTGLRQVDDNCLVYLASDDLLYSIGGRETTDGGLSTTTLGTADVIELASGSTSTIDLPAGMGPRRAMSCAYDPGRQLIYVFGGSVVNDRFNEIENEYHNDLWVLDPSDDSWTPILPDTVPGIFLEPDEYGDRRFEGDVARPNFGMHRGHMEYDAANDRLVIMGEVPIFTHQQPYYLYMEGIESYLP